MKKLLLVLFLMVAGIAARAQQVGTLTIIADQYYSTGQPVILFSQYDSLPCCVDTVEVFWQLTPCDPAGNIIDDPVISVHMSGNPNGQYIIPGSEDLQQGKYLVEHNVRMSADMSASSASIIITMECKGCRLGQPQDSSAVRVNGGFLCYPNPAAAAFYIQLPGGTTTATAELYNATGQRIDAFEINNRDYTYTIPEQFAAGVYLLRVTTDDKVYTQHLVLK
jgi:hypothetical protein